MVLNKDRNVRDHKDNHLNACYTYMSIKYPLMLKNALKLKEILFYA